MIGDITDQDVFDLDDLNYEALGRLFVRLLYVIHDEEGFTGEMLVALAMVRLLARLRREGTI